MAATTPISGQEIPESTLRRLLAEFEPDPASASPVLAQKAVHLARYLQSQAMQLQTREEKKQQRELELMMQSPHDKATLMQMTDQALRSHKARRVVDQLIHILDVQGIPRFFTPLDRTLLKGFQSFGSYLPGVAAPLVRGKMQEETANVILPAEEDILLGHLSARRDEGLRMNVNLLGEAMLGEEQTRERLESYLEALRKPEIECISIKISTIYSQISSLAWEETVEVLCDRLEALYREAAKWTYTRADGKTVPKFVYLDMEEYRDMFVTTRAFMRTLDRPGLESAAAGIALQAYLPDAWAVQKRLNAWARQRVADGGAPITLRLVKGANMEMEAVEASTHGWPLAPFKTKLEVDANFKRMLQEGMRPDNLAAVRLALASHNLFELAYGLVLAEENGVMDKVQWEMLEGMANHQRRALAKVADDILLYAPAARKENFIHAIGYLVRRLDENTGPDNFLSHAFKLEVDSEEWHALAGQFLRSFELLDSLPEGPRRTQDRREPAVAKPSPDLSLGGFDNEPDTDFSLQHNVEWAKEIAETWASRSGDYAADIPLVVAGEESRGERRIRECLDPSRPGVVVGRYREASEDDLAQAIRCARDDPRGWRSMAPMDRAEILANVAEELRKGRADLMGAAMADGGKTFLESDPEVSEAVDFVEFYRRSALAFQQMESVAATPKGIVAVVPPWNFPIAIPCGGVAAALAAGNCVILKPASDTVLVAYELCRCFWNGGVPREALQFMPCQGSGVGAQLAAHEAVDAVILTGGTDTALRMLDARPGMNLLAETGGKDATIVTAMADRDQAIKNILHSAFSHSGQKCSATSLLVLEEEVYEDATFKKTLCDAVSSLHVGSAWDRATRVGPLIRPPGGELKRAIEQLEPGESWAVEPKRDESNPNLVSPGVKYGLQPGGFTHMTELFGPVLGVIRAKDLDHAIELVNQTGYGLTSGLESLDDREQTIWKERIRAGNLYVNRVTTGAIVLRQPFGGMGKSAFGPGIKAGGPNYVAQFMDFKQVAVPAGVAQIADPFLRDLDERLAEARPNPPEGISATEIDQVRLAMKSYGLHMAEEFGRIHDHFRLRGQDNIRRYLPVSVLRIRVHPADTVFELFARVVAARTTGCRITVSVPPGVSLPGGDLLEQLTESWGGAIEFVEEPDKDLARLILQGQTDRVRYAAPDRVPGELFEDIKSSGQYVATTPVLAEGRIELLWYMREQSISDNYHRYGNLGEKGADGRAEVM